MSKVAIVGMGRVGSATAYNLGLKQTVDTILAIDNNQELADMQAKDLIESFIIEGSKTRIKVSDYQNLEDVDVMIITAGAPTKVMKDRMDLFDSSLAIMKNIVESAVAGGFKGIYLIASNPVDVMSAAVYKYAGVDANYVIGSGTILDNSRLINELSQILGVDPRYIKSTAIGEHGNGLVPLFSEIMINEQLLDEYLVQTGKVVNFDKLRELVVAGGPKIFGVKGATEFGIASSLVHIVEAIINDTNQPMTITNRINVEGVGNVFISDVAAVNRQGYVPIENEMDVIEYDLFIDSAKVLYEYQQAIK